MGLNKANALFEVLISDSIIKHQLSFYVRLFTDHDRYEVKRLFVIIIDDLSFKNSP